MPSRNGPTPGRARRPIICEALARAAGAERTLADRAMARGDWDASASCEERAGRMNAAVLRGDSEGRERARREFGVAG